MPQISYTQFDPFNHGTTSIEYRPVSKQVFDKLSDVLQRGWQPLAIESIEQVWEGVDKASNNFKVELDTGTHIIKESHINSPKKQYMVNSCLLYFHQNKVPTPVLVPTTNKKTYLDFGEIYCLYKFIDSEHFDGSQYELRQVASNLGKFHKVLSDIPYEEEIRELNGEHIIHNRVRLEEIIKTLESIEPTTEYDHYALSIIDEVDHISKTIIANKIDALPSHIIHYDVHPHNLLFHKTTKDLLAFIDFDSVCYSQRARDFGFAMHRMARTYGKQTEKKNDIGTDIKHRAQIFLEEYLKHNLLTDEEIKALPWVIQDEALSRVINVLGEHYLLNDQTWSFDLPKQVTTLREGLLFDF